MNLNIRLFVVLCVLYLSLGAKPNDSKTILSNVNSDEISFRENKGQVCDQNFKTRTDVLFSGYNGMFSFFLKPNGISYQLKRVESWKEALNIRTKEKNQVLNQFTIYRIDIEWLNTKNNFSIQKGNAVVGYNNYYSEQTPSGALESKSYESVTYQQIYAGVDLKWYVKDGDLKYDYVIAAGADYKQIKFEIKGATDINIGNKGELIIKTPLGDFVENAPVVLQGGKILSAKWILKHNIVSFDIEGVDECKALIIDPLVRLWGTYFGDSGQDVVHYLKTDASNNVYVSGYTGSSNNIATTGAFQNTFGGQGSQMWGDAFVTKYNSAGVKIWCTYYGGMGSDVGNMLNVDGSGNVYLVGGTMSTNTSAMATPLAHQTDFGGGSNIGDAFIVKFDANGLRLWGTYFGGTGDDYADGATLDNAGNLYLTGVTSSAAANVIATPGSFQQAYGGGANDAFLAKFDSNGKRIWATYYGGSGDDNGLACNFDSSGNILIAGYTTSSNNISTPGAHQVSYAGGSTFGDGFFAQFDAGGNRLHGSYYGGAGEDYISNIISSASGDIFISGSSSSDSSTSIATLGSYQSSYGGGAYDLFLANFNSALIRKWSTYYGGLGDDAMGYCAINSSGIYLSGRTTAASQSVLTTSCAYQASYGGGFADAVLSKFDFNGNRLWSTLYGGTGTEDSPAVSCDTSNNVYLTGATSSSATIMSSPGSQQSIYGGGICDGFIAKFDGCIPVSPPNTTATQNLTICSGNTTTLSTNLACGAQWFSTPTGGIPLFSDSTFTTPILMSNTTYYIEESSCGIAAPRTQVTVTVLNCTPVEAVELSSSLLIVYPNPSRDKIRIECKEQLNNLLVFNAFGERLAEVHFGHSGGTKEVDVSSFAPGVYFLQASLKDKVLTMKIIIEE